MKHLEIGSNLPEGVIPEPQLSQSINWEYIALGALVLLVILLIIKQNENRIRIR